MSSQDVLMEKEKVAGAAIAIYRIVKFDTVDDQVIQGAAVSDLLIGIAQHATTASGQRVRCMFGGISQLKAGGTIARGDYVTSDATGQGVASAPGAGVNNNVIGRAMVGAASGDVFPVLIAPGRIQG